MRRLPSLNEVRAARWADRALRHVRRELAAGRTPVQTPEPPSLPPAARRGVEALLRRRHHSCLEGAIVRQRWLVAHAIHRDVVIGVTSPSDKFAAHAWVDGEEDVPAAEYLELTRLTP